MNLILIQLYGILLCSILFHTESSGLTYKHNNVRNDDLPAVYDYFTNSSSSNSENLTGLSAHSDGFYLNGKRLKIISGAMHYFRIHPAQWRDRIKKLRAIGANTLETYVPWNLHEPQMGQFDFGNKSNDMSIFLDVQKYLQIAREEDLLVLFRPGPFICGEWDFGGLPSWLLRDPDMEIRTNYQPYLDRIKLYFDQLLPLVVDLQFSRGGPIIGIQLENEYGSFNSIHKDYLEFLYKLLEQHGFVNETFLFTSDTINNGDKGTLPDKLFMTANFQGDVDENFGKLKALQPDKPVMAMEFWGGWFDHWNKKHHTLKPGIFVDSLDNILGKWNGSVNFYMFHGGTNFNFLAGANVQDVEPYYAADITSYDYDSPLSESGDYTPKYLLAKALIEVHQEPRIRAVDLPTESPKRAYSSINLQRYLTYDDIISQIPKSSKFKTERPVSMEDLSMNDGSGQSYGYIIYRKILESVSNDLVFEAGPVKDFGMLLVDSRLYDTGFQNGDYWLNTTRNFTLDVEGKVVVDLFIENTGRINYGTDYEFKGQKKGLHNDNATIYKIDGEDIRDIEIISLEFKSEWIKSLVDWKDISNDTKLNAPLIVQSYFEIDDKLDEMGTLPDTFLDMSGWHKGIVFVNGFNIGRYFKVGPQQTLYVPGPLLRKGMNTVAIFEQLDPGNSIKFREEADLGDEAKDEWKVCKSP